MRIIAGSLKGRRLEGPGPEEQAVRPTSDRAREALFSILEPGPRGAFLDLFAGTGAVGLEALSRGFAPVTLVESAPTALRALRVNARGTEARILSEDAFRLGAEAFRGLELVFADPPYPVSASSLARLATRIRGWLAEDGRLVWEAAARDALPIPEGFRLEARRRYGAAAFHFLTPCT